MLVTLKEILQIAEEKTIAVGAFNAVSLESLQANFQAAQELDVPLIIQFAQCHEPLIPLELIGPIMVDFAKKAEGPVCVHLDHGETLEYLQQALEIGFTGIMYDGSTLSYEENLANSAKAVEMAGKYGASVEAELGSMGRRESGAGEGSGEEDDTKIYTDPVQAKDFVMRTGIDALACRSEERRVGKECQTSPQTVREYSGSHAWRFRCQQGELPGRYPGRRQKDQLFYLYG